MWDSIVDLGLHSNCDVVEISAAQQLHCSYKESGGGGSHTGCDLRGLIKGGYIVYKFLFKNNYLCNPQNYKCEIKLTTKSNVTNNC